MMRDKQGRRDNPRDRDSARREAIARQCQLAAGVMLRAAQRRRARQHRVPWPDDQVVDPRLVGQSKRAGGFTKPGLALAIEAMHDLIALDGHSVNKAAKILAGRIHYYWSEAWMRHAERSDDLEQLGDVRAITDQLRTTYNRTYK
jgi:hypothetical protein